MYPLDILGESVFSQGGGRSRVLVFYRYELNFCLQVVMALEEKWVEFMHVKYIMGTHTFKVQVRRPPLS